MIRAEDLMIGDWAYIYHPTRERTPVKVDGVWIEAIERIDNGLRREDSPMFRIVEPIPLTPEILEKNGFKKSESGALSQTWIWAEKSKKIYGRWVQITFYNEPINGVSYLTKIETCSRKGDGVDAIHSCDIESIHELQHALRLCGINLEIKL